MSLNFQEFTGNSVKARYVAQTDSNLMTLGLRICKSVKSVKTQVLSTSNQSNSTNCSIPQFFNHLFVQLKLNEADTIKSVSTLIY